MPNSKGFTLKFNREVMKSMPTTNRPKTRGRGFSLGALTVFAIVLAIIMGKLPNPLDRFFEIGPGMYCTLSKVVVASKSQRLQQTIKSVLDNDGKLTLANMASIWPVYMQSIPSGMTVPVSGAGGLEFERQRLVSLVFAQPKRVVPTFSSWPGTVLDYP